MLESRNNNVAVVIGTLTDDFVYSHSVKGEKFYTSMIESERYSGTRDKIEIVASEMFVGDTEWANKRVSIKGQYRSYNEHIEGSEKSRLVLQLFVFDMWELKEKQEDVNMVTLHGFVCKPVKLRETPFGRHIAEVMLAVNRPFGKSDYIPCILWGRSAKLASTFKPGKEVIFSGRIQSRKYTKKYEDGEPEVKTVNEVSVSRFVLPTSECQATNNNDSEIVVNELEQKKEDPAKPFSEYLNEEMKK